MLRLINPSIYLTWTKQVFKDIITKDMMHTPYNHKLEAQHIHIGFNNLTLFKELFIKLKTAEIVGLVGDNGSGKSTLLKVLATLKKPSEGQVLLNQQDIYDAPSYAKQHIGYLSEVNSFYPYLTINECLELKAELYNLNQKKRHYKIENIKLKLGLPLKKNLQTRNLSQGQTKKLGLALALLHEPTFILLDEPTAELDAKSQEHLLQYLNQCKKNHQSILFSTHQMSDLSICDRVLKIENNQLIDTTITNDRFSNILYTKNNPIPEKNHAKTSTNRF